MNNYQNVGKGLNRMFIATFGIMACIILATYPLVGLLFPIGMLVFYMMDLSGYYLVGKELKSGKLAFIIRIFAFFWAVAGIFLKIPSKMQFGYTVVNDMATLVALVLVLDAVSKVLRARGEETLAKEARRTFWVCLICNLIVLAFSTYTNAVGEVMLVRQISPLFSFAAIVMRLRFFRAAADYFMGKGNPNQQEMTVEVEAIAIEISEEVHPIYDEYIGYGYFVNKAFKPAKSHAGEVDLLCTYAPNAEYGEEGNTPYIAVQIDDEVYCAVEEYKESKTFDGAISIEPLDGKFLFKAKREYYDDMMYFYGFELEDEECWDKAGLCLVYSKAYVGTEEERKLMHVLDEAAKSFKKDLGGEREL